MMNLLVTFLGWTGAVFGFGLLVLIHELGHFMALRRCGRPVFAFSIGFGSPVFRWQRGGTEYRLGWIPLGGYVMPVDPDELDRREAAGEPLMPDDPPRVQAVVAAAGPAANLVLAAVLFALVLHGWGNPVPVPTVDSLVKGSAAATAGLQSGDSILKAGGRDVSDWPGLLAIIQENGDRPMQLRVQRGKEVVVVTVAPRRDGERFMIGMRPRFAAEHPWSIPDAVAGGISRSIQETVGVGIAFSRLFTFHGTTQVGGPIAILDQVSQAAQGGWFGFLTLLAILSVNLAVFNLLPLPPLDGLKLILAAWHAVVGRPLREQVLMPIYQWGTIGLAILFLLVTIKDIGSLFM
ncbi:MAG TPA: M50 family metallopeptidase [Candidatus Ozemobacteraceae bacterium]|nr:M50 family metallopeptidase [Candidatus Ozemobacteraceae bacterium]